MSRRQQSTQQKQARRQRYRDRRAQKWAAIAELPPRRRWQGSVSFQLGKDPRTRLDLVWSGVRIPVDLSDPNHMDGVVELTELALAGAGEVN